MSDEPEIWYDVPDDTPYPEPKVIERLLPLDEAAIRADERERIAAEWKSDAKDQRSWLATFEREVRADERAKHGERVAVAIEASSRRLIRSHPWPWSRGEAKAHAAGMTDAATIARTTGADQ